VLPANLHQGHVAMAFDFSIFRVRRQQTPRELRIGGAIMLPLGVFVTAGGVLFAWLLLDLPIPVEWLPAGTRIERSPGDGPSDLQRVGLGAIALLLLTFGTATIIQSVWQLVLGRQSQTLLRLMLVIVVIIVAAGVVASGIMGRPIGRVGQQGLLTKYSIQIAVIPSAASDL